MFSMSSTVNSPAIPSGVEESQFSFGSIQEIAPSLDVTNEAAELVATIALPKSGGALPHSKALSREIRKFDLNPVQLVAASQRCS